MERLGGGSLQYTHREDDKFEEEYWTNYYKSQIGSIVEITIYEEDDYCELTSEVKSSYKTVLIQEILCFCIGSIGFPITLVLFIKFLRANHKNNSKSKCGFIQG
ncbi:MAG: hypothetical protein NC033_04815 [Clostridiales bacterium]|nr:hypothetical protein [Clostridiales bacterium]